MRLLWIPHTGWFSGVGHRAQYLINWLKERHEVHVITWSEPRTASPWDFANPTIHLQALIPWTSTDDAITLHHIPRWCVHRLSFFWKRNQQFLHEAVRKIVRDHGIEAIIFGPSAYLIGYPPTGTGASLIFDYVDHAPDEVLEKYLGYADSVTCVSRRLQRQVLALGRNAIYVPNGADVESFQPDDGAKVRAEYGIEDRKVISLIGLTCSPDFYFVESLHRLSEKRPETVFLFVGKGPMYKPLRKALNTIRTKCIWAGWIPKERVHGFFSASDIGLYPGADSAYFRSACPIKLLEYAAARKPSVSSPVEEIDALGLRSVIEVEATATGFLAGIMQAMSRPVVYDIDKIPSWQDLAGRLEVVLGGGSPGDWV